MILFLLQIIYVDNLICKIVTFAVLLFMKSDISEKWHFLVNQRKQSAR